MDSAASAHFPLGRLTDFALAFLVRLVTDLGFTLGWPENFFVRQLRR